LEEATDYSLTRFENWRKMGSFGFLKGSQKKNKTKD
jgi:hypothetical protein